MDLESSEGCFKILPDGCKYSGTSYDFFEQICEGHIDTNARNLKDTLVRVYALEGKNLN